MPDFDVALEAVEFENIRGFEAPTTLDLRRSPLVLVGPNNSGKTSALRVVDWAINDLIVGDAGTRHRLTPEEEDLLLARRNKEHRARRVTLWVRLSDGRRYKRFSADKNGLCRLRLNVRVSGAPQLHVAVGAPKKAEKAVHSVEGLELLAAVRSNVSWQYTPAFRDAGSSRFARRLREHVHQSLLVDLVPPRKGNADQQKFRNSLKAINALASKSLANLSTEIESWLPANTVQNARMEVAPSNADLVQWLAEQVGKAFNTGVHDDLGVDPVQLGSGSQSLVSAFVNQRRSATASQHFSVFEEPEAFLHPSTQRCIARDLLSGGRDDNVVITTHSGLIVDEASAAHVTLCRSHRFFPPASADPRRLSIRSDRLRGPGAEAVFADAVMLVEGPGDWEFFTELARREIGAGPSPWDRIAVVPVGGKTAFGPWIELLRSYRTATGQDPIRWVVVADGDAGSDVARGLRDAGVRLSGDASSALADVSATRNDAAGNLIASKRAEAALAAIGVSVVFMSRCLEYAACDGMDNGSAKRLLKSYGKSPAGTEGLVVHLLDDKDSGKAPWKRRELAREIADAQPEQIRAAMDAAVRAAT